MQSFFVLKPSFGLNLTGSNPPLLSSFVLHTTHAHSAEADVARDSTQSNAAQCRAIGSSRRVPLRLLIDPLISFRRPHDALDDLCAAVTHHLPPAVVDATFQLAAAAVLLEEGDEGISWSRTFALAHSAVSCSARS